MVTFTAVSTDSDSSITHIRLMAVNGLLPTRTTDVCVVSIMTEDMPLGGTVKLEIITILIATSRLSVSHI